MQSCESIISQTNAIYPLPKLCFLLLLLIPKKSLVKMYTISFSTASIDKGVWFVFIFLEEKSNDDFDGFFNIFVRCVVDWSVPTLIIELCDVNSALCLSQKIVKLCKVLSLYMSIDEFLCILLLLRRIKCLELHLRVL